MPSSSSTATSLASRSGHASSSKFSKSSRKNGLFSAAHGNALHGSSSPNGSAPTSTGSVTLPPLGADVLSTCSHLASALQGSSSSGSGDAASQRSDRIRDRYRKVSLWAAREDSRDPWIPTSTSFKLDSSGSSKSQAQALKASTAYKLPTCMQSHCIESSGGAGKLATRPIVCLECDGVFCRTLPRPRSREKMNESEVIDIDGEEGGSSATPKNSGSRAPPGALLGPKSSQNSTDAFRRRWSLSSPSTSKEDTKEQIGCWESHAKSTGHGFGLDTATGSIICYACRDLVFPEIFESLWNRNKRWAEERGDWSLEEGRQRKKYKPFKPAESVAKTAERWHKLRCVGLRPLLNLSQTCFLSAILQAFLHNPLWKSYYLSDSHNRKVCELTRALASKQASADGSVNGDDGISINGDDAGGSGGINGSGSSGASTSVGECLGCEMDSAFHEAYNEEKTPYGPVALLYSMWKASEELAGHAQQDAHTFFLTALNQIHAHDADKKDNAEECPCIARSLQSTVTCSRCGSSTNTFDPILDISLELKGSEGAAIAPNGTLSLMDCMRRFTSKEALSGRAYACSRCGQDSRAEATKQLSVKRLPATLAIQLKRFEQNTTNFSKVETMVQFPTHLDMKPFMTETLRKDSDIRDDAPPLPNDMYRYELSTVVTHEGRLDNGHYWADVRSGCEWFHCDDDKITSTTLPQVLAQKAYMLFYVRSSVSYQDTKTK